MKMQSGKVNDVKIGLQNTLASFVNTLTDYRIPCRF